MVEWSRGGAWGRGALLVLALLLGLAACAAPAPPAPGTPGLDLGTPLPYTPAILPASPTAPPAATPPVLPSSTPAAPPIPLSPTSAAALSPTPTANPALPQLVITNTAGLPVRLFVEIADTPATQETGLMHRTLLPEDQGMLFVFPSETTTPFWMENTLIPLSIAFIGAGGTIVDIQDMQALDTTLHTPAHPYLNALEVNQGYFRRHGIATGNPAHLPVLPTPSPSTIPDGSP